MDDDTEATSSIYVVTLFWRSSTASTLIIQNRKRLLIFSIKKMMAQKL